MANTRSRKINELKRQALNEIQNTPSAELHSKDIIENATAEIASTPTEQSMRSGGLQENNRESASYAKVRMAANKTNENIAEAAAAESTKRVSEPAAAAAAGASGAAETVAEEGAKKGFFRRHWKATGAVGGTVLAGLALTVGIARASMAGGEKTNSELYNPQQQNY